MVHVPVSTILSTEMSACTVLTRASSSISTLNNPTVPEPWINSDDDTSDMPFYSSTSLGISEQQGQERLRILPGLKNNIASY